MTGINVVAIRAELGAAIAGLNVHPYDHTPENVEFPALFVGFPDTVHYLSTFEPGSGNIEIPVLLIVGRMDAKYAQMRLAAAVSTAPESEVRDTIEGLTESGESDELYVGSVREAIHGYETSAWHQAVVNDPTDYGEYEIAGKSGLGVVFPVDIHL